MDLLFGLLCVFTIDGLLNDILSVDMVYLHSYCMPSYCMPSLQQLLSNIKSRQAELEEVGDQAQQLTSSSSDTRISTYGTQLQTRYHTLLNNTKVIPSVLLVIQFKSFANRHFLICNLIMFLLEWCYAWIIPMYVNMCFVSGKP